VDARIGSWERLEKAAANIFAAKARQRHFPAHPLHGKFHREIGEGGFHLAPPRKYQPLKRIGVLAPAISPGR